MASGQQFLFAPQKPLVERLGQPFFREIPCAAGIYKMHDALGNVVYVGKAKNLRQRLRSYRVANPERLGRRHLRLLQQVTRIEFELCDDESAALSHEARLIRELKPKFNRAGVWPGSPRFLTWRFTEQAIEFSVSDMPLNGWEYVGPLGAYAPRLRAVLVRLLWLIANPHVGYHELPHGWTHGRMADVIRIVCFERCDEIQTACARAWNGEADFFLAWLTAGLATGRPAFELTAISRDLEELQKFFERQLLTAKSAAALPAGVDLS